MRSLRLHAAGLTRALILLGTLPPFLLSAAQPWKLEREMSLPDWARLGGQYRTRYETLDRHFRTGRTGGDQLLSSRLSLRARMGTETIAVVGEMLDSRQALADAGTPLNTGHVNSLELLQAYLEVAHGGGRWRLGRQTMDLGSRRLVARNRFRNTINHFNGLEFQRTSAGGTELRTFYGLPVLRRPADTASLRANESQFDREGFDLQFASLFLTRPGLPFASRAEAFLFGLRESDTRDRDTRNRRLLTPGIRWQRPPAPDQWDFDLEIAGQFGRSRASTAPTDTLDLIHRAHMEHAEVGYTLGTSLKPRLAVQLDHVSGDENPTDGVNGHFYGLFGGNRFDHGPTGVFGEFSRFNILSPGWRLNLKPTPDLALMLVHRGYWLASSRDRQGRSGLVDPGGASGRHAGQQIETRVRWEILPGNLRLECGAAHVLHGRFMREAPGANGQGNPTYAYLQSVLWF